MNLIRYSNIGINETDYFDLAESSLIVSSFFDFYFKDEIFKQTVVIKNKFLRNSSSYPFKGDYFKFNSIKEVSSYRKELFKSSYNFGHFSTLFKVNILNLESFNNLDSFYKKKEKYSCSVENVQKIAGIENSQRFINFLEEILADTESVVISFSHDADLMCVFSV